MRASVIVPSYNGEKKILNCLKALENQIFKDFEVIVVVDGSTDNTYEILSKASFSFKKFKVINQENKGRSISRNNGARNATGEILIFFDDDMRPGPHCIDVHLNHHSNHLNSVLNGTALEDYDKLTSDIQKYKAHLSRKWQLSIENQKEPLTKEQLYLTAANFSISQTVFWNFDGFDERLNDAEDFDLGVRLFKKNVSIFFDQNAIGWHDDFITCKSLINRQIEYRKAHALLKRLKPDLYREFNNHQVGNINSLKKLIFYFFSFSFWQYSIDYFNWLLIFPRNIRYKIYDYVITARSAYFPAEY